MRSFEQWMDEYGVSHTHPTNQIIHKVCVPLIMLTVVGFFWAIPTPAIFQSVPYLNWATLFVIGCLGFYLSLNFKMFLGMLVQSLAMLWACRELDRTGILLPFCVVVFIIAWIFQFVGHKIEGKKPSFLKDLVFLLIGPLWVTRFLYQKLGISA